MPDGRLTNTWGTNNGSAKLSEKDVEEIRVAFDKGKAFPMRERKRLGLTQPALAEMYGVDKGCISRIVNRKNWRHVV